MRVDWSQRSVSDLSALHDYIARDSPVYAERFIARLIQAVEPLADFPELGRNLPEEPERSDLREVLVRGYRIVYCTEAARILVVAVIHGSREGGSRPWKQQ